MAREKAPPPDDSGNVPLWFLTYSDVITLMMTFFILLLTFATSEPESFEQMKVTFFGGQGGTGIAGPEAESMERDALVMRYRPRSSRLSSRGAEQPSSAEPHNVSLNKGLEGIDKETEHDISQSYTVSMDLALLVDNDGNVTSIGKQRLRMLALQIKKGSHELSMAVNNESDMTDAITMSLYMTEELGAHLGSTSVALRKNGQRGKVAFQLIRQLQR